MSQKIGLVAIGGKNWMGGVNYIRNLARAIHEVDATVEVSYICGDSLLPDWTEVEPRLVVPSQPGLIDRMTGRPHRKLAKAVATAGLDFIYPLTYDNVYNVGLPLPIGDRLGARWAGWVPDFQHRFLPQLFTADEIRKRDEQIALLVDDAPRVLLSSASAKADFANFYPARAKKAEVLTFATFPEDAWYTEPAELPPEIPERFLLVCNQFWQHKNHLGLFTALKILKDRGVEVQVVCTGKLEDFRDRGYIERLKTTLRDGGVASQVYILGLVPRHVQVQLIRRSLAIVQPSLFEGWSTVVEDARVMGKPCVLSDIPVHLEQNPPGARFFSANSPESMATALEEAWNTLSPGPDSARENEARSAAARRIKEVGQRFLEIARS